jgi:hypothetical protein
LSHFNNFIDEDRSNNSLVGIEGGIGIREEREIENNNINNKNYYNNNQKISVLNQLHSNIREQLSNHVWEIISYNPLKFLIAHYDYKQIIYAVIKEENKNLTDLNGIENGFKEIAYSIRSYKNCNRSNSS